jgi:CheY-like chemotaxis protein
LPKSAPEGVREKDAHHRLLVEDEDAIRLTLRDYLDRKGFSVLVASDGVGAIKHLLDHTVDVIITDYRMDVLGGEYWIRFLDRFCTGTRIIVTSGFLRPEFPIPFDVVYKPFDYAELAEMIGKSE